MLRPCNGDHVATPSCHDVNGRFCQLRRPASECVVDRSGSGHGLLLIPSADVRENVCLWGAYSAGAGQQLPFSVVAERSGQRPLTRRPTRGQPTGPTRIERAQRRPLRNRPDAGAGGCCTRPSPHGSRTSICARRGASILDLQPRARVGGRMPAAAGHVAPVRCRSCTLRTQVCRGPAATPDLSRFASVSANQDVQSVREVQRPMLARGIRIELSCRPGSSQVLDRAAADALSALRSRRHAAGGRPTSRLNARANAASES
jgi:hypothetical protein